MNNYIFTTCNENDERTIEKYHGNPFTNSKEDYYNEKIQKIICSILASKNIKKINYLVFDVLFDYFIKIIKTIGVNCRKFSSLRGSVVVNYIDIKYCLKLAFSNLYTEIYVLKNYNKLFGHLIFDILQDDKGKKDHNNSTNYNNSSNNNNNYYSNNNSNTCSNKPNISSNNNSCSNSNNVNYINVVQNSYLYYKQLCMKKKDKYDSLNDFNNINYLPLGTFSSNENVNVLFLNENIDIEKYKEIMKLKKKYIHDHMPIIPLSLNRKEKKTGYYNDKTDYYEQESSSINSSSNSSSTSSSSTSSDHSSDDSDHFSSINKHYGEEEMDNKFTKECMGQEKIDILNLIPKLKDIYTQNAQNAHKMMNQETGSECLFFNSLNIFDAKE
ncbi:conserved Plasmodium protein, unknown function [Plasmodium malariae]|uniref:Uncharacterized protein n=1 Tax=Plasmodium malariae TaxID=5858 RepID=A0A1C3KDV2_PLAMA|nr:conserved Plasmodium protein, unknown function [Plasmodium malariae]